MDMNTVIKEAVETFRRMRKDVIFDIRLDDDLCPIDADFGQMQQVLMNLFVNAGDAMPDSGKITVETKTVHILNNEGFPYPVRPGHYIRVSVSNTGIGMDEATLERIFEPFFTTKEMGRGTGLGLASVYGIVKGHNGYIDVRSRPREGATFDIYFPVSSARLAPFRDEKREEHIYGGKETILTVDDEEEIVNISKEMLEMMGYCVLITRHGHGAIKVFRQHHHEIRLVLLDMIMPGMNGEHVYEEIKKINPAVRSLLMSGYSRNREAINTLVNQGCSFLQKPFKLQDLSHSIRQALDITVSSIAGCLDPK